MTAASQHPGGLLASSWWACAHDASFPGENKQAENSGDNF